MSGMKGIELQRRMMDEGRRTPMIFITAYPEETTRTRALEAGAAGFLSKPFDEQALINSLNQALKEYHDWAIES